jgi:hypothetical protein
MDSERRKYVRFFAEDNTFAALRSEFKKVGKVVDISIRGLGFSYISEIAEDDSAMLYSQADIFISGNGFHLSNVPCKVVYDISTSTPSEGSFIQMSRCGLHFGDLTESQSEQLKFLLENHTKGLRSS